MQLSVFIGIQAYVVELSEENGQSLTILKRYRQFHKLYTEVTLGLQLVCLNHDIAEKDTPQT